MNNHISKLIAVLGALGVLIGAFGAHAIKSKIGETQYASYQTGVMYHFIHILAILALYIWYLNKPSQKLIHSIYFFTFGIILFSGSLYMLATREWLGLRLSFLGPITPLGGILFTLGWLNLALLSNKNNP